jgi:hypothetical protein
MLNNNENIREAPAIIIQAAPILNRVKFIREKGIALTIISSITANVSDILYNNSIPICYLVCVLCHLINSITIW